MNVVEQRSEKPIEVSSRENIDSGLASFVVLARFHAVSVDADLLAHDFKVGGALIDEAAIMLMAQKLGLKAKVVKTSWSRLTRTPLPAIAIDNDGRFFILARVNEEEILIQDPLVGRVQKITQDAFLARWQGRLILMASKATIIGEISKFDFSWFVPAVVKYRRLLFEVLAASFVIQCLALIAPLFSQVVMDKVLAHQGYTTLDVMTFGYLMVVLFDAALKGARNYIFSHTSSRIDVELGSRLFRHLLRLPLNYFVSRRVGDSVARVRELESIRSFLTGNAITLVLDLLFSLVFVCVMFFYSVKMTWIVLLSLPCYVAVVVWLTPVLRSRLQEKFSRSSENQSFLVETISNIHTVKSMSVEPHWIRRWDSQLAAYVGASFRAGVVSSLGNGAVNLVSRLSTIAIMWFGVHEVLSGDLTLGQFIAFNMLAQNVSSPVMRLSQMWSDFQQTGVSVQRLGDILNVRPEMTSDRSALPTIRGRITFDQVRFRYKPDGVEILRGVNLDIRPGEVVGIVGHSGSGKSTLTRLVERLYVPTEGRVLVDGIDLSVIDPASLRRQIGVVLQESMLFSRSIRENIALSDPGISLDAVIQVAKLAGAHDFISELPEGYDTPVAEHGSTLSGGQRQRIAIARALICNPRILIFDEATSALDYESERVIQDNMDAICKGRTVLIITHRLSAARRTHRIIVLDKGQLVEQGTHDDLLNIPGGYYARLYQLQQG